MKQVQIPESLFRSLVVYFTISEPSDDLYYDIQAQLLDKLDRLVKHNEYKPHPSLDQTDTAP